MRLNAYGLLTIVFLSQPVLSQCLATVSGSVVDLENHPVPGASISVLAHGSVPTHEAIRNYQSDSSGAFQVTLQISRPGEYWILPKFESAGYPDTILGFYNDREPLSAMLRCNVTVSGVTARIGPKAGYIKRITVLDAETGSKIAHASITLRRLSSPLKTIPKEGFFIRLSTVLSPANNTSLGLAVPSGSDVSYAIAAPGYLDSVKKTLHLAPLQSVEISAELHRIPGQAR